MYPHRRSILFLFLLLAACASAAPLTFDGAAYTPAGPGEYRSPSGQALRVETTPAGARVSAGSQVYLVSGAADELDVTFPDGRVLTRKYAGSSSSGLTGFGETATLEDWQRVEELRAIVFARELAAPRPVDVARLIFGLFLLGFGALEIAYPRLAFQVAEGWRYENLEPSPLYLSLSRVGGAVMTVIGLLLVAGFIR